MTYPFGIYTGEPTDTEILQRLAFHLMHGPNHLAIHHICPACNGKNTEWVRNQWAICYDCEIAFDAFELYVEPTPNWLEYIEEEQENEG